MNFDIADVTRYGLRTHEFYANKGDKARVLAAGVERIDIVEKLRLDVDADIAAAVLAEREACIAAIKAQYTDATIPLEVQDGIDAIRARTAA